MRLLAVAPAATSPTACLRSQHRANASRLAAARNQCYMQATSAYLGGNKSLASQLRAQGASYATQMRDEHRNAARAIFAQRNQPDWLTQPKERAHYFLDLHGLHVAEAMELLEEELGRLHLHLSVRGRQARDGPTTLMLCVGRGLHSKVSLCSVK